MTGHTPLSPIGSHQVYFYLKLIAILVVLLVVPTLIVSGISRWQFGLDQLLGGLRWASLTFVGYVFVSTGLYSIVDWTCRIPRRNRWGAGICLLAMAAGFVVLVILHYAYEGAAWGFLPGLGAVAVYFGGWILYDVIMLAGLKESLPGDGGELYHDFKLVFAFVDVPLGASFIIAASLVSVAFLLGGGSGGTATAQRLDNFACGLATMHLFISGFLYMGNFNQYLLGAKQLLKGSIMPPSW